MNEVLEVVQSSDHLFLDTPFTEYTVTEGLLLLLVLAVFFRLLINTVRRFF